MKGGKLDSEGTATPERTTYSWNHTCDERSDERSDVANGVVLTALETHVLCQGRTSTYPKGVLGRSFAPRGLLPLSMKLMRFTHVKKIKSVRLLIVRAIAEMKDGLLERVERQV